MDAAIIVSLVVSFTALAISAASLWHSALKPAEIIFDHLPGMWDISGGGHSDVPAIHAMSLAVAVSNAGARAGLLESIQIARVESVGAPEMATAARRPRHTDTREIPTVQESDGTIVRFPRTVEAGEVRSFRFRFELAGIFHTATNTRSLDPPDRWPLAQALADLDHVAIVFVWAYRRQVGLFSNRRARTEGSLILTFPAERYRTPAIEFWSGQGRTDLIEIANGSEISSSG